ncbi:MAG: Stp1/IreP family PP2C-type Ser/Thr phosphatase [Clostridia bacterium]|nr:Stp1/IreP family PP2C-type Ser/Thr phosphatase [Clostridia bacterium]
MKFGVRSDKGMVREINEDCCDVIAGYPGVPVSFIIADGMGGHNSGEIASRMAIEIASNQLLQLPELLRDNEDVFSAILQIMQKANSEIYRNSLEHEANHGMGTTLIIAVVYNRSLYIGHIGDSRVYRLRDGTIQRITTDHSFIEEMVMNGSLTREEAENHPRKNLITRALGCAENIQIDTYLCDISDKDIFMLCTDGLTNMLSDDEINQIIDRADDPEFACNELVNRANEKGGEDNITVILFKNT